MWTVLNKYWIGLDCLKKHDFIQLASTFLVTPPCFMDLAQCAGVSMEKIIFRVNKDRLLLSGHRFPETLANNHHLSFPFC